MSRPDDGTKVRPPLTPYQRKLFFFLSVATFFEGYDFIALTQILPNLRAEMGFTESGEGLLIAFINLGTVVAYLLVRKADQWGRRRVLTITIIGYTVFTFATGFATNVYMFGIFQFFARIFLIAEWATAMVYAAEEFPAERRATVIGVIQATSTLGSVFCAGMVPILLTQTVYEWRSVYFVSILPLMLIALMRRDLKETTRFQASKPEDRRKKRPLMAIMRSPYRGRLLKLSLIWALTYICTHNAVTFWKEFVVHERGFTDGMVGLSISLAAIVAMPMCFYAGKLLDQIGRRRGAVIIFTTAMVGVVGAYQLHGQWPLTAALTLAIFGATAVLPVLNAYTTELFPTDLRGDAFAWSNNLLGRIGYVLSPLVVGLAAADVGWGTAVTFTAIFPMIALVLILVWMPETRGMELEETSAI
jgi:putative MFS transporter